MSNICDKCIGCNFRKEPKSTCQYYVDKEYWIKRVVKHEQWEEQSN